MSKRVLLLTASFRKITYFAHIVEKNIVLDIGENLDPLHLVFDTLDFVSWVNLHEILDIQDILVRVKKNIILPSGRETATFGPLPETKVAVSRLRRAEK